MKHFAKPPSLRTMRLDGRPACLLVFLLAGSSLLSSAGEDPQEGQAPAGQPPASPGDQMVAELGNLKILAKQVWAIEKMVQDKRKSTNPEYKPRPGERAEIRKQIAMKELEMLLLDEHVAKHNLAVTPEEASAQMEQFKKSLADKKETYEGFLAALGKSDADFRRTSTAILAIEKQLKTLISEDEIAAFFEKNKDAIPLRRCSEILVAFEGAQRATTKRSKAEAKKEAEAIQEVLRQANDFSKLARERSDSPSKEKGGDLEEFLTRKGPMVEPFSKALYEIPEVGKVSDIVETDFGFHLIKLTELRGLGDYKDRIREGLVREKFDGFMQRLRMDNMKNVKVNQKLLEVDP